MSIQLEFEWDEDKRLKTIVERGLDFADTPLLFDGRPILHQPSGQNGEDRLLSIAALNGKIYAVVWTWRGQAKRIISLRRARHEEERKYRALYSS